MVLAFLTSSPNSCDSLRERSSDDSSISFAVPSIRQSKTAFKSNTVLTAVTVSTHQAATSIDSETRRHDLEGCRSLYGGSHSDMKRKNCDFTTPTQILCFSVYECLIKYQDDKWGDR